MQDTWILAGRPFRSRLLVGTGKYASLEQARAAIDASGAEIVTVAVRRVDLTAADNVLAALDRQRHTLLPNTAGCYTVDDAVRTARLAREAGMGDLVKLEVIGDPKTLFPDNQATLEAARRADRRDLQPQRLDGRADQRPRAVGRDGHRLREAGRGGAGLDGIGQVPALWQICR